MLRRMWIAKYRRRLQSDFAFRHDTTLAVLPLVIAFLTMLSICMTHSAAYMKHVTLGGSENLEQRIHVHIPFDSTAIQMQQMYEAFSKVDGIGIIKEIPKEEVQNFLARWLSVGDELADDLPLPTILDIKLQPNASRDMVKAVIEDYVSEHIDGGLVETYDETISSFNQSAHVVKTGLYILGFLIVVCITLVAVIICRINMGVHQQHIEILHHLGASDHYINRQFLVRAFVMGGVGVAIGTFVALIIMESVSAYLSDALMPVAQESLRGLWVYYVVNPCLLMALILGASWINIEAHLKRLH
ncbi:MAG: FtsX-like permease family protein [Alphaproteobacteria bacterium]|nr:MAG: FtsX-like permease family protein [Alphaproteobacteria bacterium]